MISSSAVGAESSHYPCEKALQNLIDLTGLFQTFPMKQNLSPTDENKKKKEQKKPQDPKIVWFKDVLRNSVVIFLYSCTVILHCLPICSPAESYRESQGAAKLNSSLQQAAPAALYQQLSYFHPSQTLNYTFFTVFSRISHWIQAFRPGSSN